MLAIDTCLQSCGAAILDGENVLARLVEPRERGHAERLAPLVSEALTATAFRVADLTKVIVTIGPGSFTGVRLGLAFARGLAIGRDLPVIGISTLQALAVSHPVEGQGKKIVLIDARRGQVYGQTFDYFGQPTQDAFALSPEEAASCLPEPDALSEYALIGSGVPLVFPDLAERESWRSQQPDPVAMAMLGAHMQIPDTAPSALYLRAADATPASSSSFIG